MLKEITNRRLIEIIKITQHLRIEFNKETELLERMQDEIQMELENTMTQLENAKESLTVRYIKHKKEYQDLKMK